MDELIDIVDENGKPTGKTIMKSEAHGNWTPHRSVHIWIYNSSGQVLMQKRSSQKQYFPETWDVAIGGHIGAGEEPDAAGVREGFEEIGVTLARDNLNLLCIRHSLHEQNGIKNDERIFTYACLWNGDISELQLQKEEVEELRWFTPDELFEENTEFRLAPHGDFYREICTYVQERNL